MTAHRLICWRHGQTAFNIEGKVQGTTDTLLDEVGRDQVGRAARVLAELKPTAIIASDLQRAAATAAALVNLTGVEVQLDPRLRERAFGLWEGLALTEIEQRWPIEFRLWRSGQDIESVGQEGRAASANRYVAAVTQAAAALDDDATLVVASHGGVTVCGITALLGLDPATWRGLRVMTNAHWAVLEATTAGTWRLEGYNLGPTASAEDLSGLF